MFGLVLLVGLVALAIAAGKGARGASGSSAVVPPPPPVPGSAAVVPPMPPPLDYEQVNGRPQLLSREDLRAMSVTSLESYIRRIEASGLNVTEGTFANSLASARQELGSRL